MPDGDRVKSVTDLLCYWLHFADDVNVG